MKVPSINLQRIFRNSINSREQSPLHHRICWRWCVRYTIVVIVWASLTTYIWISSWTSCDSRFPESSQVSNQNPFISESVKTNEQKDIELPQIHFFFNASENHFYNQDLVNQFEQNALGNSLPTVYTKKWVGFPDIDGVDCQKALRSKTKNDQFPQSVKRIRASQYILDSQNCNVFLNKYGFNRYPKASEEEKEYPIAFIILFYKDLDQVLFLLRALYHPHNVYCLSVDTKASIEFFEAVRSITRCLPNVFVASKLENIVYAGFTRLMADIDCMDDLLRHPVQWKYVINMPGQQFPLRSNLEMVGILKYLMVVTTLKDSLGTC
uniref:Uncharacterized protein n=1 Tax=Arion vulgaris TaxID=1028688 RepID=A0A0B7AVB9_9EUPU